MGLDNVKIGVTVVLKLAAIENEILPVVKQLYMSKDKIRL